METQLMKPNDVARKLQVSRALAYRLMAEGDIPSVRFGRTVRIKEEDLLRWIETHTSNKSGVNGGSL